MLAMLELCVRVRSKQDQGAKKRFFLGKFVSCSRTINLNYTFQTLTRGIFGVGRGLSIISSASVQFGCF